MRRSLALFARNGAPERPNLIQIQRGTFYREHPSADSQASNPPLFPLLSFELPATLVQDAGSPTRKDEHWAVIAAKDGTTFLEILRGVHLCLPPKARTYPYLASEEIEKKDHRLRTPSRAIQYVGFNSGKGQTMGGGIRGAYLSARYESRREETDWSVLQYLKGETELNPSEKQAEGSSEDALLSQVIADLRLQKLVDMPVSRLSNGQTRRSRIAKALLGKPELLLLDEPFMGLDPPTLVTLSPILRDLAYRSSPLLLLGLRPQDPIPDWITHLVILGHQHTVALMGPKAQVLFSLHRWADAASKRTSNDDPRRKDLMMAQMMSQTYGPPLLGVGDSLGPRGISKYQTYKQAAKTSAYFETDGQVKVATLSPIDQMQWRAASRKRAPDKNMEDLVTLTCSLPADLQPESLQSSQPGQVLDADTAPIKSSTNHKSLGSPLIELHSVVVKYGDKTVLGFPPPQEGYTEPGLNLTISQGTRLALLGPNGSGKTTLLSLLTSDHPHSYSLPIKFFGRSRLPTPGQPGLSLWDIQSRIGHSAPEVHAFFPKRLNVRQVLESAWSETYSAKPKLNYERDELVDRFLRWWEPELRQNIPVAEEKVRGTYASFKDQESDAIRDMVEQSYPPFLRGDTKWGDAEAGVTDSERKYDLSWAEDPHLHFSVLPFGTQRLLLLLRAIIKKPDIVVLDEAFSGFPAEVRDKAMCWLEHGETKFLQRRRVKQNRKESPSRWEVIAVSNYRRDVVAIVENLKIDFDELIYRRIRRDQYREVRQLSHKKLLELSAAAQIEPNKALMTNDVFTGLTDEQAMIVVSHVKEEIPPIVNEWIRLPAEEEVSESGRGVEMGRCDDGSIRTSEGWNRVWGFQ